MVSECRVARRGFTTRQGRRQSLATQKYGLSKTVHLAAANSSSNLKGRKMQTMRGSPGECLLLPFASWSVILHLPWGKTCKCSCNLEINAQNTRSFTLKTTVEITLVECLTMLQWQIPEYRVINSVLMSLTQLSFAAKPGSGTVPIEYGCSHGCGNGSCLSSCHGRRRS